MNPSSIGDIVVGAVITIIAVAVIVNNGLNHRAELRAEAEAAARRTETRPAR